jgi:DnaK suppressor protein
MAVKKAVSKKKAVAKKKATPVASAKNKTTAPKKVVKKATSAKKATVKKAVAKKTTPTKKTAVKKAVVKESTTAKKAVAKKTTAKKAVAKKTTAKKAVAKKTTAAKKAVVAEKVIPAKKAAVKKTASKKAPVSKKTLPAKKIVTKATPPAKKPAATKKNTAIAKKSIKKAVTIKGGAIPDEPIVGTTLPVDGIQPYTISKGESYMNDEQYAHFRKILIAWKRQLMEEVDRTVHHMKADAANHADPADRATQEEEFSLELRTRDRERKLIKKIDESLVTIDLGDYGYCEACGIEVGIRRLEARPTATLCIDCKTLQEIKEKQNFA